MAKRLTIEEQEKKIQAQVDALKARKREALSKRIDGAIEALAALQGLDPRIDSVVPQMVKTLTALKS